MYVRCGERGESSFSLLRRGLQRGTSGARITVYLCSVRESNVILLNRCEPAWEPNLLIVRGLRARHVAGLKTEREAPTLVAGSQNRSHGTGGGLFITHSIRQIHISQYHQALLISDRALDTDQGQKIVYVVNDNNEVVSRPVRIGALHDGLREITDGLKPGERVVINGLQQVQPGMIVEPKLAEMPRSQARSSNTTIADAFTVDTVRPASLTAVPTDHDSLVEAHRAITAALRIPTPKTRRGYHVRVRRRAARATGPRLSRPLRNLLSKKQKGRAS